MSSVRMCDRCGQIFSENSEDWSTFNGTVMRKDDYGKRISETVVQDACGDCTNGKTPVSPRLALPKGVVDPVKVAQLEDELDMPRSGTGLS
jgi:hypothetical protein